MLADHGLRAEADESGDRLERSHEQGWQQANSDGAGGRETEQDALLRELHAAKTRAVARRERLLPGKVGGQVRQQRLGGAFGGP